MNEPNYSVTRCILREIQTYILMSFSCYSVTYFFVERNLFVLSNLIACSTLTTDFMENLNFVFRIYVV